MKAIINGKIVLKDRVLENKAIVFDKKIVAFKDEKDLDDTIEKIDANGNFVTPGLVDIHIHGYVNEDVSDGTVEGIIKMSEAMIKNGVTSWCPTTMTVSMDEINKSLEASRIAREESKKDSFKGAEILGVHAEGPFINPSKKGAQAESHILKPDAEFVKKNSDIIKTITLAPEMDDDYKNIKEITQTTDVVVSIGHTGANFEQTKKAVEAGVSHTTHLFNAMTPLAHRDPGVVGAVLTSPKVSCEIIADTFHVHPGIYSLVANLKKDKFVLITDCMRAGGMGDGESELGGQKVYVKGIECRLQDGTIAGSVLRLNLAVKNFFEHTDFSISDAVNAASYNPAKVVKEDNRKGSLEEGKDADIVIMDKDFNVLKTIIGGNIRYEK